jgi:hypothetical protein
VVLVLVEVLWVWANVEATAKPKAAAMVPSANSVFISDIGFRLNLVGADTRESLQIIGADVKTSGAAITLAPL